MILARSRQRAHARRIASTTCAVIRTKDGCASLRAGGLGLPGDEILRARGWLRRAAMAFYRALALVAVAAVALVVLR